MAVLPAHLQKLFQLETVLPLLGIGVSEIDEVVLVLAGRAAAATHSLERGEMVLAGSFLVVAAVASRSFVDFVASLMFAACLVVAVVAPRAAAAVASSCPAVAALAQVESAGWKAAAVAS